MLSARGLSLFDEIRSIFVDMFDIIPSNGLTKISSSCIIISRGGMAMAIPVNIDDLINSRVVKRLADKKEE